MEFVYDTVTPLAYDNKEDMPGDETILRTDVALDAYLKGIARTISLSGKHSARVVYETTHAQAQIKYLSQRGVPLEKMFFEEIACDTAGQAFFIKRDILKPQGWKSILVVTSDYHVPRTKEIFNHILGPEYTIGYAESKAAFQSIPFWNLIRQIKEKRSLRTFLNMFGNIRQGDDEAISKIMFEKHKLYRKR